MIRKLLNSPFHFTGSFKLGIACHFPEPSNLFLCGHGIARKNQLIQRSRTNCLINKDFSTYPAHLPLCYACEPRQLNLPEAVTYLFLDEQSEFLLVVGSISVLDEVGAFVDRGEQSLKERKMLKILNDFLLATFTYIVPSPGFEPAGHVFRCCFNGSQTPPYFFVHVVSPQHEDCE